MPSPCQLSPRSRLSKISCAVVVNTRAPPFTMTPIACNRVSAPREALTAVIALVDAVIRPGVDGARLLRMPGQREALALAPQPLHDPAPALAAVSAGP